MEMTNKYYMSFEEAQEYISKRGLDIPWNDCDVFIDGREITRTVCNVLKWADNTMIDKACQWITEHINIPYEVESIDGEPVASDYIEWCKKRLEAAKEITDEFRKAMEE